MLLFFGQKFAPKLIMFTCLTAALRIDPLGDGARMNFAMFRSFITISACVIYYVLGLAYTKLAHPSFLRQLFGRRHPLHTLYLYALRGLVIYAYVSITITLALSLTLSLTPIPNPIPNPIPDPNQAVCTPRAPRAGLTSCRWARSG